MKPLKTAILARVSHDEQAKFGYSIENQLDKLRAYAKENNLLIVDEYVDEGYSAGSMKRPELQRLLRELDRIDLIIFTRLDRFSRNVLDANEMVKLFNMKKVSIRAIEEDIDTSSADGMFLFNMKVSLAQRELEKGSERINTVFEYKVKQGQPISGSVPFGYIIETSEHGIKKVVKDEEVSHIVDEIFEHFLKHHSIRQMALYINDKYNLNYAYMTYNRILRRPLYAGVYRGNNNFCDAYISKETFDHVQMLIANNIRVRKNNFIYLFSGLIRCPKCKKRLTGLRSQNVYGDEYYYYRCNYSRVLLNCDAKYIREDHVEEFLFHNINSLIEDHIYAYSIELDNKPKPAVDIKAITDEMDRLTIAFRKGRVKEKEYDYEYELLECKLAEAQREMPEEANLSGLHDFLNSGWKNVYHELDKVEKRALFRSVIKHINIDTEGNISVEFL